MELIGCTSEELKSHLQNKFTKDMSYDNYGEWEIDHIIPISSYDFSDFNKLKECFNYKNLQPLSQFENRSKSNSVNFVYTTTMM
jgi:5-methylcytosine-specific restriction endonuclease McrA